jgi:BlaI family penicillinase repressor
MPPKKSSQPSEFELQVLGVLWEHGPQTVRQVMERLTDGKARAYTSVLSVMQVMQKKGLLRVDKQRDGLAHVFRPKVSREQIVTPSAPRAGDQGLWRQDPCGRAAVA